MAFTTSYVTPSAKPDVTGLYSKLFKDYSAGKEKAEGLFGSGLTAMQDAMALFAPGGAFEQSAMQKYQQGKTKAMSGGMQNLISSGLAKSSTPAALERGYEQEVGNPYRTAVAAEGQGRLASAMQNLANYGLQYQNLYPSAGNLSYLATGGFGALSNQDTRRQQLLAAQTAGTSPFAGSRSSGGGSSGGSSGGGGSTGSVGRFGGGGYVSPFGNTGGTISQGSSLSGAGIGQAGEMMMGADADWRAGYFADQVPSTGSLLASGGMTGDIMDRFLGSPIGTTAGGTGGTGGSIKIQRGNDPSDTRTIQVAAEDLGSGPGGFKDEATYLRYLPSGWQTYKGG